MKKIVFYLFIPVCSLLLTIQASQAAWTSVGSELNRINTRNAYAPVIALADTGSIVIPYIAWTEADTSVIDFLYVKKWNGVSWQHIGSAGTDYPLNDNNVIDAAQVSMVAANSASDQLVVAWREGDTSGDIFTKRWNGTSWDTVPVGGPVELTVSADASNPELAMTQDSTQVTYMTWASYDSTNSVDHVFAARLNNAGFGSWKYLPVLNISVTYNAQDPSITTDQNNRPVIAWSEENSGGDYEVHVKRLNLAGDTWVSMGGAVNSADQGLNPSVAVNGTDIYVAFVHAQNPPSPTTNLIRVNRLNGSSWEPVGSQLNSDPGAGRPHLIARDDGELFITWADNDGGSGDFLGRVHHFNGSSWEVQDSDINNSASADAAKPHLGGKNNQLYVTWEEDPLIGSSLVYCKAWTVPATATPTVTATPTIDVDATATRTPVVTAPIDTPQPDSILDADSTKAYPMPASRQVHFVYRITDGEGDPIVRVYNTHFRLVAEMVGSPAAEGEGTVNWDCSSVAPGVYFYQIELGDKKSKVAKFIIAR